MLYILVFLLTILVLFLLLLHCCVMVGTRIPTPQPGHSSAPTSEHGAEKAPSAEGLESIEH